MEPISAEFLSACLYVCLCSLLQVCLIILTADYDGQDEDLFSGLTVHTERSLQGVSLSPCAKRLGWLGLEDHDYLC